MAKIKLNISDTPSVKAPEPKLEEKKAVEAPKPTPKVEPFKEKQPCNWYIVALDDGSIRAVSSQGDSFTGSRQEFNKRLRS